MQVKIYLRSLDVFDRTKYRLPFDQQNFIHAATLAVDGSGEDGLEQAFIQTQNVHGAWNVDNPCRSTMVGDVFETDGTHYLVDSFGFTELAVETPQHRAYVIAHPDWGVYLGAALGFAFFSNTVTCGQDSAPTFPNLEAAREHVATWVPYDTQYDRLTYHEVLTNDVRGYASIQDCVNAGLPSWTPEATSTL